MKEVKINLREYLLNYRKTNNLSHESMAKKLGITRQKYGHYESGRANPSIELLQKMSEICDFNSEEYLKDYKMRLKQFCINYLKFVDTKDFLDDDLLTIYNIVKKYKSVRYNKSKEWKNKKED